MTMTVNLTIQKQLLYGWIYCEISTNLLASDCLSLYFYFSETAAPVKQSRRKYERDFLLQFQYMPVCLTKPAGLPDIEIVLDAPPPPSKGGGSQRWFVQQVLDLECLHGEAMYCTTRNKSWRQLQDRNERELKNILKLWKVSHARGFPWARSPLAIALHVAAKLYCAKCIWVSSWFYSLNHILSIGIAGEDQISRLLPFHGKKSRWVFNLFNPLFRMIC
jgi:hypothetical protein